MKSRLTRSVLAAASMLAPLALIPAQPVQAQSIQRPANDVVLSIGRGQLVTTAGRMSDVFVANEKVADVQIKSNNQLYVFGKGPGETTVYASDAAGRVVWSATVRVGSNIESVDQMLALAMPDAKVMVSTMGTNTMLLTGTVGAPEDAAEVQRLVSAYVGDKTNVISRLKMATPLQVNLRVRFAEVSRSLVRNLGMNWSSLHSSNGFMFGLGQATRDFNPTTYAGINQALGMGNSVKVLVPDPANPGKFITTDGTAITPTDLGTTLAGQAKLFGVNLIGALDAGEKVGLVTTLSEPNLTALSGETADFLAGGEYPIPISQGLGTTSIEYKKYGVSLAYTPTVLSNGRISLRVRPEVSELSTQGAVMLNGYSVPALTIRRAETTIELGSGQSFMIAGLMNNATQNDITKMPGAGSIPILGSLFRSTAFKRGETELVIIVTPYLVNPVNANDIRLPTDGFSVPGAIEQLLLNSQNEGKKSSDRPKPTTSTPDATPDVGMAPSADAGTERAEKKDRRSRKNARSAAAAPGFNLN